ncbi:hypothetical protein Cgig2_034204 [Carnegiea gigantea]|uniref:Uncharacterized protein n=1 Tax=Carnegiea gigantea TaxID=171969 RepID=A0A9Q1K4B4_9CARY|nr:hypothetical protein Cgig2_034204 [Carnegiea gigantea]
MFKLQISGIISCGEPMNGENTPTFSGSEATDLHAGGLCCCRRRVGVLLIWVFFRPMFAGVEGGDMGCEKEREIRKVESLPWLRNDGARCSIAMPRRGEAEEPSRVEEREPISGKDREERESSGGREEKERAPSLFGLNYQIKRKGKARFSGPVFWPKFWF